MNIPKLDSCPGYNLGEVEPPVLSVGSNNMELEKGGFMRSMTAK